MTTIVQLNVGGTIFTTTETTLCLEGSLFAKMFSGKMKPGIYVDEILFLDRNPKLFEYILDYLRNLEQWIAPSCPDLLLSLYQEAMYFILDGMIERIKQRVPPYQEPFEVFLKLSHESIIACGYDQETPPQLAQFLDSDLVTPRDKSYTSNLINYDDRYCGILCVINEKIPNHKLLQQVKNKGYLTLVFIDRYDQPIYTVLRSKLYPANTN
jgi:BTB/POZ domain